MNPQHRARESISAMEGVRQMQGAKRLKPQAEAALIYMPLSFPEPRTYLCFNLSAHQINLN